MTPCFRSLPYWIVEYSDKPFQESSHDTKRLSGDVKEQSQMVAELLNYSKRQSLEIKELKDIVNGILESQHGKAGLEKTESIK